MSNTPDIPEEQTQTPSPAPKKNFFDKLRGMMGKVVFGLPKFLLGMLKANRVVEKSEMLVDFVAGKTEKIWKLVANNLPHPWREAIHKKRGVIALGLIAFLIFSTVKNIALPDKPKTSLEDVVAGGKDATKDAPVPVKGFKVARFNFEDSLNALGTIKGAVEFKISFEVPGTVSSINYREGERYEEGALLLSLKQDDILLRLKRAQAEMNKAQTQAQIAEKKVAEHEKLYSLGAIPQTTLDNIKLELDSSKFEAEAARLEVKANEAMLEKSNLYAPSAGMIGELNIEEGEAVTANTLLGTHINTEYVYAEFGIVERDVNKIALGQKARVFVDAFPDKTFEGVIENISPVVTGTSRTATVRVRIENPERLLLPGMFARVRILLYSKKNTLVVPTDSVQGNEGEKFIYIIHKEGGDEKAPSQDGDEPGIADQVALDGEAPEIAPDDEEAQRKAEQKAKKDKKKKGKDNQPEPEKKEVSHTVEKRAITIGYTRPDYSQIDAGISEGELVAISSLEKLEDGKKVRLLETQEAEV